MSKVETLSIKDGRKVIRVSEAAQGGGQAMAIGGHILRCYSQGDRKFTLELPGNITPSACESIIGAVMGLSDATFELTGEGACIVEGASSGAVTKPVQRCWIA